MLIQHFLPKITRVTSHILTQLRGNPVTMLRTVAIEDRKPCKKKTTHNTRARAHTHTHTRQSNVINSTVILATVHCLTATRAVTLSSVLNLVSPTITDHSCLTEAFSLHLLTSTYLRSFSTSSSHFSKYFLQPPEFPTNNIFTMLMCSHSRYVSKPSEPSTEFPGQGLIIYFFRGSVIFLKIFLSNTAKIFISFTSRLQVSAARLITGRTTIRYILSLVFRDCILHFKMGHQASQQRLSTYNRSLVSMFVSSSYVSKAPINFNILSLPKRSP